MTEKPMPVKPIITPEQAERLTKQINAAAESAIRGARQAGQQMAAFIERATGRH